MVCKSRLERPQSRNDVYWFEQILPVLTIGRCRRAGLGGPPREERVTDRLALRHGGERGWPVRDLASKLGIDELQVQDPASTRSSDIRHAKLRNDDVGTHSGIRVIQEVLHCVALFVHDLGEDLGETRYAREVVVLQRRELPQRRIERAGSSRVDLVVIERVCLT